MGKTLGRLVAMGAVFFFPVLAPLALKGAIDLVGLGPSAPKPSTAETALKRPRASSMLTIAEDGE